MLPKKSIENVLHVTPAVSDRMADAIQLWSDMYEGHSPWLREPTYEDPTRIVSVGLPALIASEKARMVTLEMKSEISAPMENVDITQLDAPVPGGVPVGMPIENGVQTNLGSDRKPAVGADDKSAVVSGAPQMPTTIQPSTAFADKKRQMPTGPVERADFLNKQYKKLLKQIRRQLEYGIAKGGLVIKPYIVLYDDMQNETEEEAQNVVETKEIKSQEQYKETEDKNTAPTEKRNTKRYGGVSDPAEIEFDFVQADRFFPLSFDANGKVLEAAFVQTKVDKGAERVYIRLEYHKLEKHTVTVQNLAFESTDMSLANSNNIKSASNLGKPIPLTDVAEWANLAPSVTIENVDRLLFAYFRMPEANTIDPYSPLGVSGYSRVIKLIKDADMQYSRLLWEFEAGEMAIDVDRDALAFVTDPNGEGRSVMPQKQQRLFRKIDLNSEDTYNVFAPGLRDVSITSGLNTIFMRIEDATGLSRGTLSDVNTIEAKTATELKILKQRSYSTNADIQQALQDALEDAVYVMDVYASLYDVVPDGEYEVSFEWDDSIIVDSESELSKRLTLMQNGLASKLETRMWYFGETENQAREALRQIDEEATQTMMQSAQAKMIENMAMGGPMGAPSEEEEEDVKSPADTTDKKISKGKQADSLDNPNKSQTNDKVKGPADK